MTKPEFIRALLWSAIEDYTGLWELVWELNTLEPETDEAEHQRLAEEVVRRFLRRGWVRLFRCQEPYGELTEVPEDQVDAVLSDPEVWQPADPHAMSIRISATSTGETAYNDQDTAFNEF